MQQLNWWKRHQVMVPLCLIVFAVVFVSLACLSDGTYGGGDSWMHYMFARYAFAHPSNFMEQWAKPVYTMLAAPFAQFGFLGIRLFNCGCALLTAYLSYRIADRHFKGKAWISILFVCSVPIWFICVFSGLTEIVFALFIITGIWLYQEEHEGYGFLLISFLPFVRSEGFLILPLFGLMGLYYKQYRALPLLATGTILFALAGYLMYRDIGWIWTSNPYVVAMISPYGHGSLLSFVMAMGSIAGVPQLLLLVAALVIFVLQWRSTPHDRLLHIRIVLIFGSFAIYFIGHSIFWRLGIFGSLGLTRVMAGIGPCIALTAYGAFHYLSLVKKFQGVWMKALAAIFLLYMLLIPFALHKLPVPFANMEALQARAGTWITENNVDRKFVFYADPFTAIALKLDPFDAKSCCGNAFRDHSIVYKKGALLLWDSHYAPVEGGVSAERLEATGQVTFLHMEHGNSRNGADSVRIYRIEKDFEFKDR